MLWLMGDNGAGKTTLLKLLLGRLPISDGDVFLQDKKKIHRTNDESYQQACFYLGHHQGGAATMQGDTTVVTYLRFIKKLWRGVESIATVATTLQLERHLTKKIKELSSGMQKKLQLAAMLWAARQKTLWLLDEPFTALDNDSKQWLWQWLVTRANTGNKIIFTSHDGIESIIARQPFKKIEKIYL